MLKNISILRGYMGEGVIILIRGLLCNYWGVLVCSLWIFCDKNYYLFSYCFVLILRINIYNL